MNRTRGFTLVEMMLVVIIIAITASIAVPRYARSFGHMKLKSAALDIAATVEHARNAAVLEEQALRLTVSSGGSVCTISSDREGLDQDAFSPVVYRLPSGIVIESLVFDDPLLGGKDYVRFLPDGWSERCTLSVADQTGDAFEVLVQTGLGRTLIAQIEK